MKRLNMKSWLRVFLVAAMVLTVSSVFLLSCSTSGKKDSTDEESRKMNVRSIKGTPDIVSRWKEDPSSYRLEVHGMVNNPLTLSLEQIKGLENVREDITLHCVEGWSEDADWTGVPLKEILELAGPVEGSRTVIFRSADDYSTSLSLEDALDPGVLVVYEIDQKEIAEELGYPVRLAAEGKLGYKWIKWLTDIEITDEDFEGFWERRGYDNEADVEQ